MSKGYGQAQLTIIELLEGGSQYDPTYWIGTNEIIERTGLKAPSISRAMKRLINDGVVLVKHEVNDLADSGLPKRCNCYMLASNIDNEAEQEQLREQHQIELQEQVSRLCRIHGVSEDIARAMIYY